MLEQERFTENLAFCRLGASQPFSDSNIPTSKEKAWGENIACSMVVSSETQESAEAINLISCHTADSSSCCYERNRAIPDA